MRKSPPDEVVAAARRRLELLGRELDQAGVARLPDAPPPAEAAPGSLPPPGVVHPSGRHAAPRPARPTLGERLSGLVPDSFRGGVALDRGALVVVLVLALLGAGAAAYAVTRDAGTTTPAPPSDVTSAEPLVEAAPSAPVPSGAVPSGAAAVAASGTVTVHVAGKVRRPGVLELPAGSRVDDAVQQAGGARRGTDLSGLNLARMLVDGEQVLVGVVGPVPGAAASAAEQAPGSASALVSLNTASLDQLDTLPGVGPVTAQKIVDWREANGAFSAVEELLEVDGIGDKTLAEIAPHVTL